MYKKKQKILILKIIKHSNQISPICLQVISKTSSKRFVKRTPRATTQRENIRINVSSPLLYTANGWMNDPNGLVFVDGTYHLFYQFHDNSPEVGNISWGHAVGQDLVTWQEKGVALPYDSENQIAFFSGSAVYDKKNTCGLGSSQNPPIVAIYTNYFAKNVILGDGTTVAAETQAQSLAYSVDKGNTWSFYEGNPVIRIPPGNYSGQFKNFRDPKVFWYEPDKKWVMVTVLSELKLAMFFSSQNLKRWTFMSVFGTKISPDGVWECPDLFELTLESEKISKWVLIISTNPGGLWGGSGMHYYLGSFNGTTFTEDNAANSTDQIKWLDFGSDFYAGITWNNADKRYLIGWVNNWEYGPRITKKWFGGQSIVREMGLARINNQLKVVQKPVKNLSRYRVKEEKYSVNLTENGIQILRYKAYEFEVHVTNMGAGFSVIMTNDQDAIEAEIAYSSTNKLLLLKKMNINPSSNASYVQHSVAFQPNDRETLQVFIDDYSLTLFNTAGDIVFTELLISNASQRRTIRLSPENKANVTFTSWLLGNEVQLSSGIGLVHSFWLVSVMLIITALRN